MLVKISDTVSVNPDYVASVTIKHEIDVITVLMSYGEKHILTCDYGKSIWETAKRIDALINGDDNG